MRIGVISDTHGLLRAQASVALQGCDLIIHAGDIGKPAVLDALRQIAPVQAIRGNVDAAAWATALPEELDLEYEGRRLHVRHDLKTLAFDPAARGFAVVISGHSHKPSIERRDGVLFLNPGSAGPRRFRLPICLALLELSAEGAAAQLIELS